jgi:hypothetical protein
VHHRRRSAWPARVTAWTALAALIVLAPRRAGAVSPAAEALFQEGRRLMAAGKTEEACLRFAESNALDPSSGELLNLALCHETLGRTATAWAEYRAAARLARKEGRDDRAGAADAKVAALEPSLARLTIVATTRVPSLKVVAEQGALDEGGLGVSVPIDPGRHQVTASAPGYRPWTGSIDVKSSEQRTLTIPALEVSLVAAPGRPPRRWSAFERYAAGGGAALVVAGAVFYGVAYEKLRSARAACDPFPGCTTAEADARQSTVNGWQELAIGAGVAGGALLLASGLHHWFGTTKPVVAIVDPLNEGLWIRGWF